MGNKVKTSKYNSNKRNSTTDRMRNEIDKSIDSTNFNYSTEYRKNISFYSNYENYDVDKDNLTDEITKSIKNENFSKNNLEELRNRNFKSIEYSTSRTKRLESIKQIEKKIDNLNIVNLNQNISLDKSKDEGNISDLKLLIKQSVDNVNNMNR